MPYFCLKCEDTCYLCAFCVKDEHSQCPDSHILTVGELKDLWMSPISNPIGQHFAIHSAEFFEKKAGLVSEQFKKLKSRLSDSLSFIEYIDEDFYTLDRIQDLKKQYLFVGDKNDKILKFEPKVYTADMNIEMVSRAFKSSLQKTTEKFMSDLENHNLTIYRSICKMANFKYNDCIEVTECPGERPNFQISLKKQESESPSIVYLNVPLSNAFITVHIEKVNRENLTPIEIGFLHSKESINWSIMSFTEVPAKFKKFSLSHLGFSQTGTRQLGAVLNLNSWATEGKQLHFMIKEQKMISIFDEELSFKWEINPEDKGTYTFYMLLPNSEINIKITE
jgi:hypothetical protein